MLTAAIAGIASAYAILLGIGVLLNSVALEGTLVLVAALALIGAYLVRNYTPRFGKFLTITGIVVITILSLQWFVLPLVQGSGNGWIITISVVIGIISLVLSRIWMFRHLFRRAGRPVPPPFGSEALRWVIFILI